MKINIVTSIIAIAISALIVYGFYSFTEDPTRIILCVGSLITSVTTLLGAMGIKLKDSRAGINIHVLSYVLFFILLLGNITFSFINFSIPLYVIINGGTFLIYILLFYYIFKAK